VTESSGIKCKNESYLFISVIGEGDPNRVEVGDAKVKREGKVRLSLFWLICNLKQWNYIISAIL